MTDIDRVLRADAAQWQHRIDAGARPVGTKATRKPAGRHRPLLLAVSGFVLIAAIVGATFVIAARHNPVAPPAGGGKQRASVSAALTRVTWTDPHSSGTVVFAATTANIFDGCSNGLRAVLLRSHDLTLGRPIGLQSACGGASGPPSPGIQKFDRVLSGHLSWKVTGRTLVLISRSGQSLTLTAGGPAPSIFDQDWKLERIIDRSGNELNGSFSNADFSVRNGNLRANDLCNTISGAAAASVTTIKFGRLARSQRPCPDAQQRSASAVIDDVLSGSITFTIRGNELILYGRSLDLLVYTPKP